MRDAILEIENLSISFQTKAGSVKAVRGLNLSLERGGTLAIVGESGSGKSVTAKAVMGILSTNGRVESGSITFRPLGKNGEPKEMPLAGMKKREFRKSVNGQLIAMVFQDPMTSLDPTMPIGRQVMEGMIWHEKASKAEARARSLELLRLVEIPDAEKRMKSYPHQLSGGMRQRVVIACALANNPQLLICDEPTTALDVTIQAKILELVKSIQKKRGISVVYITHDLGVVANVADTVAVMYAGKIVELGTAEDVFYDPRHPYTWGLLAAMPSIEMEDAELFAIPGSPPNMLSLGPGDAFAPRNAYALRIDSRLDPPMFPISETHAAATWLLHENAPKIELPAGLRARLEKMKKANGERAK
jgi:oligopeptide transport system ATP-binding protein